MGIQSFAGSSSSLPGQTFIDQVYMIYKVRKWARGGSPGFYRATSALGKDGFIYYLQTNGQLVQAPLNGIADVTLPFTEIRILATQFDMITLFKVSAKGTDSLTLTANYTTITSSGLYAFPTNGVGFCDFMAVGAGGGAHHHSGGGGGGGIITATSIPMPVGQTISAIVGTSPNNSASSGGNTTFLGLTALGGGGTRDNGAGQNGGNGGGAGFSSSQAGVFAGGSAVQSGQVTTDTSASTYTSTIGNSLSIPLLGQGVTFEPGHGGGSAEGSGHGGGGGGGAGSAGANCSNPGNPVAGGAGKQITFGPITAFYSAGGGSARHSTQNNGPGGGTHWSNAAGNYGMGGDSEHNSTQPGTGGVIHVRTWSV
jgi:hypothetical protein